ncbi:thiopeptide-type bacteriocin biosynthesis protein [Catellatospora methionotrophica]|uniref:thiopeptide-type bacteriocin biosynthesis protein n=1 Tax=Catellatospora methionotrophica TaxID=121620 RepID=UPI0034088AFA
MTAATLDRHSDARVWLSLHCFAYWPAGDLDDFLCRTVATLLDRLRREQRIDDWFYIRYWEGGPHLRLRLRGADPATAAWLREELGRLLAEAPFTPAALDGSTYYQALGGPAAQSKAGWHEHGEVREIAYVAETPRYGGADALPIAEEVFCRSSDVATRIVAATADPRARLAAATELTIATAMALGLDRLGTARWLRIHAGAWRFNTEVAMLPTALMQERTSKVLAKQAGTLNQRWARTAAAITADPDGRRSPVTAWAAVVREANERLAALEPAATPGRWLGVWASQLHMLFNRLGITPDEERSVCWLVAGTALAPEGLAPFFTDGAQAADRRYHEASKFLLGGASDHAPREVEGPPAFRMRAMRPPVVLPAHDAPRLPLADVLRTRRSARGAVTGPLVAEELGTLLWSAHAISHHEQIVLPDGTPYRFGHRPYPSAGARYVAKLRLVVRDVAGVDPGCYHVDPADRTLWWMGGAPSDVDLLATSTWFQPDNTSAYEGIDISAMPAMLALYVELGRLRPRYGMRALRFATAEAGHLAQNLSLVAAASGLSLGMIGGFYDDVAHEVFGLDGIDNVAIYLMPVGRQRRSPDG